jgi:hypothetical protein
LDDRDSEASRMRAASDHVLMAAQELLAIEEQKRQLAPADPRFRALAEDACRLAEVVTRLVAVCADQAREVEEETLAAELASIAATPPDATLAPILDEWRSIERELGASQAGSPEAAVLIRRFHTLRAQYTRAAAQLIQELAPKR